VDSLVGYVIARKRLESSIGAEAAAAAESIYVNQFRPGFNKRSICMHRQAAGGALDRTT
jgi:hypothetical protein